MVSKINTVHYTVISFSNDLVEKTRGNDKKVIIVLLLLAAQALDLTCVFTAGRPAVAAQGLNH